MLPRSPCTARLQAARHFNFLSSFLPAMYISIYVRMFLRAVCRVGDGLRRQGCGAIKDVERSGVHGKNFGVNLAPGLGSGVI